eukprot:Blabericola_migrator_1__5870@NODE_2972_length_2149_cov_966_886167_g1860_i0_p1_GENE_NODE_2972_length_2149_cov_966_886167_g1860_i0NODE_2972_length_2149_cov_966_886167_g1860_i0_p1_ORF_typecomplete_len514_score97_75Hexokinase_1/PF00349_21/8_5e53Hexokinase_2/PF03727_16/5_2e46DUF2964/PF11177_8/0_16_NODE_2972_length_2149_cov_966_886167_g1860_i02421783
MGNQTSMMNTCAGPTTTAQRPTLLEGSAAIVPTDEELTQYLQDVKSVVESRVESMEERFHRYMKAYTSDPEELRKMTRSFVDELQLGLLRHKEDPQNMLPSTCSFKMLDSFVPYEPTGEERGTYYALDFGGSNFRVVRVHMEGGKMQVTQKKASLMDCKTDLPKGLLDPKATATMMFDFFADICRGFMQENGDISSSRPFDVGFTFSYPCVSRNVASSALTVWTKGFETGRDTEDPVEGVDVGELMNKAFERKRLPLRVNCIANDTVGTLLSCAYSLPLNKPRCAVGLILGTGMNACYVDDNCLPYGYHSKIINIECGNFNRDLPRSNVDTEIDFADVGGRGRQHLEKMVSGAYMGEICRRTIVKVFQYKAPPLMWQPQTFTAEDAATCVGDKSPTLVVVGRKCQERFGVSFTEAELRMIRDLCVQIFDRGAAMAAVIIASTCLKSGRLQEALGGVTVGIDGSLYKHNAFFREGIVKYLGVILGPKQAALIQLENSDDGSGLGAAILAAIVAK